MSLSLVLFLKNRPGRIPCASLFATLPSLPALHPLRRTCFLSCVNGREPTPFSQDGKFIPPSCHLASRHSWHLLPVRPEHCEGCVVAGVCRAFWSEKGVALCWAQRCSELIPGSVLRDRSGGGSGDQMGYQGLSSGQSCRRWYPAVSSDNSPLWHSCLEPPPPRDASSRLLMGPEVAPSLGSLRQRGLHGVLFDSDWFIFVVPEVEPRTALAEGQCLSAALHS